MKVVQAIDQGAKEIKFFLKRNRIISDNRYQMLFILSAGRSGSTLLRKTLMEKYYLHIPPESSAIISEVYNFYVNRPLKKWTEDDLNDLFNSFNNYEFSFWRLPKEKIMESILHIQRDGQLLLDDLIYLIYDLHRKSNNPSAKSLGDKTPYLVYNIREISRIFPNAKFLFLMRDPKSVVASRMNNFQENIEYATNRWVWATQEMLKFKKEVNCRFLRYEDFIKEGFTNDLANWAELLSRPTEIKLGDQTLGDTVLEHHKGVKSKNIKNRNQQLLSELNRDQVNFVEKKTRRLAQKFQYS